MHIAANKGYVDIVRILVDAGANINILSNDNQTPFYQACKHGRTEVARYLYGKGANIRINGENGWSPLGIAISRGHVDTVRYLIGLRAFNLRVSHSAAGETPKEIANNYGQNQITDLIPNSNKY